jgi:hypothetical protein
MITEALFALLLSGPPQATATPVAEKEELVCHRERRTGSTVKRTVCLTKRDAAQRRADGQTIHEAEVARAASRSGSGSRSANARTPGL